MKALLRQSGVTSLINLLWLHPLGVPERIELDGLESVSFPIIDSSIKALDVDSTSPVLIGLVGHNSSGLNFENGVAISKTSETPVP